jgi:3-isopropylmalate dehydrogenase
MREGGAAARIAIIPGDGIGKEVTTEAVKAIRSVVSNPGFASTKPEGQSSARRQIEFVGFDWGADKFLREGVTLPDGAAEMLANEFDAILFGALGDPRVPSNQHAADILLGLRFKLDLYVNARPVELFHDRLTPLRDRVCDDVKFMVFRRIPRACTLASAGSSRRERRTKWRSRRMSTRARASSGLSVMRLSMPGTTT